MVTIFSLIFVHVYTPLLVLNTLGSLKIMCSYVTETILNSGFHEFRAGRVGSHLGCCYCWSMSRPYHVYILT